MKKPSIIIVVFDQRSQSEFFRCLDWNYLVSAWSNTIHWERVNRMTIRLYLAGIDGLDSILVTRRRRKDKIFIGAYNTQGELIQTGMWEFECNNNLAVCYRRVYKQELAKVLQDRLVDFCCYTFLSRGNE